jgi:hypothetical protein
MIHKLLYNTVSDITLPNGDEIPIYGSTVMINAALTRNVAGCVATRPVFMTSVLFHKQSNLLSTELAGIYDMRKLEEEVSKLETKYKVSLTSVDHILQKLSESIFGSPIPIIKEEYKTCPGDQYFFIPLFLIPYTSTPYNLPGHANGILISKAKGTVFRIEPQYSVNSDLESKINEGIIDLVNTIGMKDPTFVTIKVPCPQAIVKDENCVFWTLFLFQSIIQQLHRQPDPNKAIEELSSKPKPELERLILAFKDDLFRRAIPEFLKKTGVTWPDYEKNKERIFREIRGTTGGSGKTRRRGSKKTRKNRRT